MARNKKWSYRKGPKFRKSHTDGDWLGCTEKDKEKLERMRPNCYEFKLNKEPNPTPNAIAEEEKDN